MLELEVILQFDCCICRNEVGVTLHCAGNGLARDGDRELYVVVPCPTCHSINHVSFFTNGDVADVSPHRESRPMPVPCLN